jgi:cytoskeletal protein CcmA (bactofilin family)
MFRKKDSDPIRPAGVGDKPAEATGVRSPLELRPTPEPQRRPELAMATTGTAFGAKPGTAPGDEPGKRLIVGHGISLSGEITACDRLVVDGSVQVTLNQTRAIEITESGRFTNGKAEVEEAEISGVYEGDLTVRNRLLIRSTGQVKGTVRYGEIEVERGGRISGTISMLEPSGG